MYFSFDDIENQKKDLYVRIAELEKEIVSLRNELKNKTIEKNLYNTSSTADMNTEYHEWDLDYGQQDIT